MEQLSFDDSEVLEFKIENKRMLFSFNGATIKAKNSQNGRFQDMYCGEIVLQLQNDDIVLEGWLTEAHRILRDGGAIYTFTRWDVYPEWYSTIEKLFKIKNCIIWHKRGGGLGDLKGAYIFNHEFIIFA